MKILIAPDSFKDCLSAFEVGKALKRGIIRTNHTYDVTVVPVADGGEGTVSSLVEATGGEKYFADVQDPLGREHKAFYGVLGDGETAVIEMASASGIELLTNQERNPWIASTFGTGQLILEAINKGCTRIIIGIGGSATNDAGAGMASALGVRFLNSDGELVGPGGGELGNITRIDYSDMDPRVKDVEFIVACDVSNPLIGEQGASYVYGPQKGADVNMVKRLDENLSYFAHLIKEQMGVDIAMQPGSGAAGGLGAGLMVFCSGKLQNGFSIVAAETGLKEFCQNADIVITGEGRIDFQTKFGKTPQGVCNIAKGFNLPVIAVAGSLGENYQELYTNGFDAIFSIVDKPMELEQALSDAPVLLENIGQTIGHFLQLIK